MTGPISQFFPRTPFWRLVAHFVKRIFAGDSFPTAATLQISPFFLFRSAISFWPTLQLFLDWRCCSQST